MFGLGLLGVLVLIVLPFWFYNDLPDRIPKHFNAAGQPDAFGTRSSIWISPIVGVVLFIGMAVLNQYPHLFNYLKPITQDNYESQYRNATRLLRLINVIMVWVFAYITYGTIQTALGKVDGLGPGPVLGVVGLMVVISVVYMTRSGK